MIEVCSICIPRLLSAKAPVSSNPISGGCQLIDPSDFNGGIFLHNRTVNDVTEPVMRTSHSEAYGPVARMMCVPKSQKSNPNKHAERRAQAIPDFPLFA